MADLQITILAVLIEEWMKRNGRSWSSLMREAGLSNSVAVGIKRGSVPRAVSLYKLAEAMTGISYEDLNRASKVTSLFGRDEWLFSRVVIAGSSQSTSQSRGPGHRLSNLVRAIISRFGRRKSLTDNDAVNITESIEFARLIDSLKKPPDSERYVNGTDWDEDPKRY